MKRLFLSLAALLFLALPGAALAASCNDLNWVPGEIRYDDGAGNCYRAQVNSSGVLQTTGGGGGSTANITQFGGTNVSTGTGASGLGIPRVTVSNDSVVGLAAGTNLVGKAGIDQTTQGTTNGVVLTRPTSVSGLSGNVANALAQGTISATASVTNYIDGLVFTYAGATAASVVTCTVTGLKGGTFTFIVAVPAGATLQGETKTFNFPNGGMPASATNTAIVAGCPALGTGNTNASIYIWGHQF